MCDKYFRLDGFAFLFVMMLVIFFSGCLRFSNHYFVQGSEGYTHAIERLQEMPEGRKYLEENQSLRVVTLTRNGSIYVYPENSYPYSCIEFTSSGEKRLMFSTISYDTPDVVYEGREVFDKMIHAEQEEGERQRLLHVADAIRKPKKITMKEFMGIQPKENLKSRIMKRMPELYGDVEHYYLSPYGGLNADEIADAVKTGYIPPEGAVEGVTIPHGFRFFEFEIRHSTGEFISCYLDGRSLPIDKKYDFELSRTIDDIRAFMHTDKMPEYKETEASNHKIMRSWEWRSFETSDHQILDVWLTAHSDVSCWGLLLVIRNSSVIKEMYSPVVVADKPDDEFNFWTYDMGKRVKEIQNGKTNVNLHLEGPMVDLPMVDLYNSVKNFLVIVSSDRGVGSGFLVKNSGHVYFYTNEHVIKGAKYPRVTDLDGHEIVLGEFQIAKGRDIVRFKVKSSVEGLELFDKPIDLNMPVAVFGNSDGAGVATALNGKILGLGPDLLEISAEIIKGNSGSPVLSMDGHVVGVATFAVDAARQKDWVKKNTRFNGVRRFALRIDNADWTTVDWNLYSTIVNR